MVFGFPLIQVRIYLLPHLFTQNYSHNQQLGIFKKTPHCAKNYLHNQQLGILKNIGFLMLSSLSKKSNKAPYPDYKKHEGTPNI